MDSAPKAVNISWGDHATFAIQSSSTGSLVKTTRNLVRNSAVLDAGYYPMLRNFYSQISQADQQQIVLTRAKAENGN